MNDKSIRKILISYTQKISELEREVEELKKLLKSHTIKVLFNF